MKEDIPEQVNDEKEAVVVTKTRPTCDDKGKRGKRKCVQESLVVSENVLS